MPELETGRLVLRPVSPDDRDLLLSIRNEPRVLAGTATGEPLPEERMVRQLARWLEMWRDRDLGSWVVMLEGESVGFVLLDPMGEGYDGVDPDALELGVVVHPDHWGSGIAGEAGLAVAVDAFTRGGQAVIYATVDPGNDQSRAVVAKVHGARLLSATAGEEVYEFAATAANVGEPDPGSRPP